MSLSTCRFRHRATFSHQHHLSALLVLLSLNPYVFKCYFPSSLLPKHKNIILLLYHCKLRVCWRGLLEGPFLGALHTYMKIFCFQKDLSIHIINPLQTQSSFSPYYAHSFSPSLVQFLSSLEPRQTACHSLCCVSVIVSELFLKIFMFLQILHFMQHHKSDDASLLSKDMSVMRSRHVLAKVQSSVPSAAALP